ncbi:alpha/beta hydrolase [Planococcus sp. CPCC 101016]|uniref:alpha/beta fold hydrolase n=1 Tax=Planococcus sp. CPCC 101016 TaxID=2599617 RepID=UPI0011B61100|nr:alpha/beta hydrolase [Planococcus sp. CPCC 101016]TWT07816.1 alpha/beta hydrolase [Planococcus sp. CPCC 101016]
MWKERIVETERGSFEVFEAGKGEPLAVTHLYSEFNRRGNSMATPFTDFYHVYLINLRGAGRSVKALAAEEYSMDETLKDLEALRTALDYEKWTFAGHSTGGMLALKYAIHYSASLTKIIAGGAAASKDYGDDENSIYCRKNPHYNRIVEIMELLNDPETTSKVRQEISYEWALMSYRSEEKLKESMKKPNSGKTIGPRLEYFSKNEYPTYDIREQLKDINLPTFIYSGKYDAQCPLRFSEEIAELIPQAKVTVFKESNHNPFSEEESKFLEFVKETLSVNSVE